MKVLTTGTLSGLGKYIFEKFSGIPWNRNINDREKKKLKSEGVDIIIHCAFNSSHAVDSNNLYYYLHDNVLLTEELINIPHKKFIFISSVDVYPKDQKFHSEDEVIDISRILGIYAITKLMSESLIKVKCKSFLILRCTSLLGKYSRPNSLIRILKDKRPQLSLSGKSSLNYVLHSDISDFLAYALKQNLEGIYNVSSSQNITLSKIANMSKKQVKFGNYIYNVGHIDNTKISSIFPAFKKTSKETILQFIGFFEKV